MAIRTPGRYRDQRGLFLDVRTANYRYWIFRYQLRGRARVMHLGNADLITLAEARKLQTAARVLLARGIDPLDERRRLLGGGA
jgi:hypothetical protein